MQTEEKESTEQENEIQSIVKESSIISESTSAVADHDDQKENSQNVITIQVEEKNSQQEMGDDDSPESMSTAQTLLDAPKNDDFHEDHQKITENVIPSQVVNKDSSELDTMVGKIDENYPESELTQAAVSTLLDSAESDVTSEVVSTLLQAFGPDLMQEAMLQDQDQPKAPEDVVPNPTEDKIEVKNEIIEDFPGSVFTSAAQTLFGAHGSETTTAEIQQQDDQQNNLENFIANQIEDKSSSQLEMMIKSEYNGFPELNSTPTADSTMIDAPGSDVKPSALLPDDQQDNLENVIPNQLEEKTSQHDKSTGDEDKTSRALRAKSLSNRRKMSKLKSNKPLSRRGRPKQQIYPVYTAKKSREIFANLKLIPVELHPFPQPLPEEDPEETLTNKQKAENVKKFEAYFKLECDLCHEQFKLLKDFRNHFCKEHKRRFYIMCCNIKLHGVYRALEHMEFHKNPDAFKCNKCEKVCMTRERLNFHKSHRHVSPEMHRFKCPRCVETFVYLKQFIIHSRVHFPPEDLPVANKDELMQTENPPEEKLQLNRNVNPQRQAMILEIKVELPFNCLLCDKAYADNTSLRSHIIEDHGGKEEDLLAMEQRQFNFVKYTCSECKKEFSEKRRLQKHISNIHTRRKRPPCKCTICGQILISKWTLKAHIMAKHQGKKQSSIQPNRLNQIDSNRLNQPIRSHQSVGVIPCSYCGKTLKTKYSLRRHISLVHEFTDEEAISCEHCGNLYKDKWKYHRHLQKAHNYTDDQIPRMRKAFKKKVKVNEEQANTQVMTEEQKVKQEDTVEEKKDQELPMMVNQPEQSEQSHPPTVSNPESDLPTCPRCGKTFKNKAFIKRHIAQVHDFNRDQAFFCSHCNKSCKEKWGYKKHLQQFHNYTAEQLAIVDEELKQHGQFKQPGQSQQPGQSRQPGKKKQPAQLRQPSKVRKQKTAVLKYTCTRCGKGFKHKYHMETHIDIVHDLKQITVYSCKPCDKSFRDKYGHKRHIQLVHNGKEPDDSSAAFTCPFCGRIVSNNWTLKRHILCVHKNQKRPQNQQNMPEKTVPCSVCDKKFSNKTNLNRHMITHTNANINCPYCPKVSPNKYALQNHIWKVHKKDFKCNMCESAFYSEELLNNHMTSHNGDLNTINDNQQVNLLPQPNESSAIQEPIGAWKDILQPIDSQTSILQFQQQSTTITTMMEPTVTVQQNEQNQVQQDFYQLGPQTSMQYQESTSFMEPKMETNEVSKDFYQLGPQISMQYQQHQQSTSFMEQKVDTNEALKDLYQLGPQTSIIQYQDSNTVMESKVEPNEVPKLEPIQLESENSILKYFLQN
ncbi:hypothetical protein DMENIID0001_099850 [Sergentomyia squamirostris]